MTKKTISLFLAICLLMTTLTILPTTAFAKSYADQLRDKGFPESYISKLVSLHNKYPKWDFQPLKTGLNFTAAVKAERSPHSKQLIERQSSLSAAYYCSCASCKNKPQEGSSWYSASQNAVMHYMDPRNFLDEKHIFQFESTAYNAKQPKGVVHCFSGSKEMAKEIIKLGMYIGLNGVATFKNARKALEVVETIPLERLVLETDCPYLAPEPCRGQRNNSALIPHIAARIGQVLGLSAQAVLRQTAENARALYGLQV